MHPIVYQIINIDSSLSRLDHALLSDQVLMEMLVQGMKVIPLGIKDDKGNFKDVCEWHPQYRNACIICTNERVTCIDLSWSTFGTSQFSFQFIPPYVDYFRANVCQMHGTLDASLLPTDLVKFSVLHNSLTGSIDLCAFPNSLQILEIAWNEFCGSLQLEQLPCAITRFQACSNKFSGEISLNELPKAMKTLSLSDNRLSGSVSIESLPHSIKHIQLDRNLFSGVFKIMCFPFSLKDIDIRYQPEMANIVIKLVNTEMPFDLLCSGVSAVLDEIGNSHPWEETIRSANKLSEEVLSDTGLFQYDIVGSSSDEDSYEDSDEY